MKKIVRLTESDLIKIVKRVLKEQSDYNVSPSGLSELLDSISSKIKEIKNLIDTNKSTFKYKIRDYLRKRVKSRFNKSKSGFNVEDYFTDALGDTDPTDNLVGQYERIIKKHNNNTLNLNLEEMDYGAMVLLYYELIDFKRKLDALEILIRGGIVDDYTRLRA